ncbi:hypothetical protein TNIN_147311 [Trichonephila inaurata madagascariensis]|uniref:Uncharacterized protein n=1 Tax=Trichonephila inaurata madagascariensis TaxID=2747483 RepID=A0A8X6YX82_9ARAC|nr:hypothetical protein TNIN_147311 [Trichonephila inaurata madagascariensis]
MPYIDQRLPSLETFCSLMYLPNTVCQKAYDKTWNLDMESCPLIVKDVTPIKDQSLEQNIAHFWLNTKLSAEKNHTGSAGRMEVCGMQKNFFRSEQKQCFGSQQYSK